MNDGCRHLDQIRDVSPDAEGCYECIELGDRWFHLRMCLTCGAVRCCDNSKNRHATKHHHSSGHPIIRSLEQGETWIYCYPDDLFLEPV